MQVIMNMASSFMNMALDKVYMGIGSPATYLGTLVVCLLVYYPVENHSTC